MKIILIIVALLIVASIIFAISKLVQLKKLETMSTADMIQYVTEDKGIYVSMAIIENGETTFHTYGQNGIEIENMDFDYEIGSISKTMAAALVSKAIEEGKIQLSDSISEYLELPEGKYYPTIERLLTHTSGYKNYYFDTKMIGNELKRRNDFYGISKADILNKVSEVSLEDKDYSFTYSNFGISVIGLVLESAYGKDYVTLLSDFLVNELQLTNTSVASCRGSLSGYWDWKRDDGYIPAGAVISDITDMASYLKLCMEAEETYLRRPFERLQSIDGNNFFYTKIGIYLDEIGMTWIHDTKNHIIWHNGGTSNYNSYIAMNEEGTKGIVILSNYGPDKKMPVTVIGAKLMQE